MTTINESDIRPHSPVREVKRYGGNHVSAP